MLVLDNFKDLGVIFDLSGGGFAAKNHQKYSLGEGEIITGKIIFNFEIPIDFVGQIKWANNEKFGCQFKGLSEKCQDQIQDYIRTGNFK